jgi:hypothetical protein
VVTEAAAGGVYGLPLAGFLGDTKVTMLASPLAPPPHSCSLYDDEYPAEGIPIYSAIDIDLPCAARPDMLVLVLADHDHTSSSYHPRLSLTRITHHHHHHLSTEF